MPISDTKWYHIYMYQKWKAECNHVCSVLWHREKVPKLMISHRCWLSRSIQSKTRIRKPQLPTFLKIWSTFRNCNSFQKYLYSGIFPGWKTNCFLWACLILIIRFLTFLGNRIMPSLTLSCMAIRENSESTWSREKPEGQRW